MLDPVLEPVGEGYPTVMTSTAWQQEDLQTFLSSWTELKHDTVLYSKQVYAEMGGGSPYEHDDRGYVEPRPEVYARLAALTQMTITGLSDRELLADSMKTNLERMYDMTMQLKTIAEKELNQEPVTDADYEFIRTYGGNLEHFWIEANRSTMIANDIDPENYPAEYLQQNPAAVVTDVATDPNGTVLQEAIGDVNEIFVIVPIDGVLRITKGAVFSYYEFTQPLTDRLTDTAWREIVQSERTPAQPDWTKNFTAQ